MTRDLAVGHYKPINSDRFLNDCHEFIFHFTPQGATALDRLALGVPYQDQSNVGRWRAAAEGSAAAATPGSSRTKPFSGAIATGRIRRRFPSKLPEQCLRLHGLARVELAMDPFTGLGSTAVACARLGVDFVGADIDQAYLDEAVAREREGGARR